MEADLVYFRRRASEERTAALQVRDGRARQAHVELAERYEDLVRGIANEERRPGQLFNFKGSGWLSPDW